MKNDPVFGAQWRREPEGSEQTSKRTPAICETNHDKEFCGDRQAQRREESDEERVNAWALFPRRSASLENALCTSARRVAGRIAPERQHGRGGRRSTYAVPSVSGRPRVMSREQRRAPACYATDRSSTYEKYSMDLTSAINLLRRKFWRTNQRLYLLKRLGAMNCILLAALSIDSPKLDVRERVPCHLRVKTTISGNGTRRTVFPPCERYSMKLKHRDQLTK